MTLTQEAIERITWAEDKGIMDRNGHSALEIAEIVMDQEIVSFCSEYGTVSFDVSDLELEG